MLSTSSLIDTQGRVVTRPGVLPDAVSEANGLVFVSEKGTATGLGAFTSTVSVEQPATSAGVVVVEGQCRVRRLHVTLYPDAARLVPLYAQVFNGPPGFSTPPDYTIAFFPTNGIAYTQTLELEDALFSLGCFVRFTPDPFNYAAFTSDATFRVAALVGLT